MNYLVTMNLSTTVDVDGQYFSAKRNRSPVGSPVTPCPSACVMHSCMCIYLFIRLGLAVPELALR